MYPSKKDKSVVIKRRRKCLCVGVQKLVFPKQTNQNSAYFMRVNDSPWTTGFVFSKVCPEFGVLPSLFSFLSSSLPLFSLPCLFSRPVPGVVEQLQAHFQKLTGSDPQPSQDSPSSFRLRWGEEDRGGPSYQGQRLGSAVRKRKGFASPSNPTYWHMSLSSCKARSEKSNFIRLSILPSINTPIHSSSKRPSWSRSWGSWTCFQGAYGVRLRYTLGGMPFSEDNSSF